MLHHRSLLRGDRQEAAGGVEDRLRSGGVRIGDNERLTSVGQVKKGESFSKDVAIKISHTEKDYRLITFVQEADEGKVLGAAVAKLK